LIATPELLARVEGVVGHAHERWLELLAGVEGNPLGVSVRRFGTDDHIVGSRVSNERSVQWLQHVHGVRPVDAEAGVIDEVLAWFDEEDCRPRFELAPADGFDRIATALTAHGLSHRTFTDLLIGSGQAPPPRPSFEAGDVVVERLPPEPSTELAHVLLEGHEVPADVPAAHHLGAAGFPTLPGYACFLARDAGSGEALGAGILLVADGVGYLANASTRPAGRGRGAQTALIRARMDAAATAGCDVLATLALPWSQSNRNLRRGGLRPAYTKAVWLTP
jgi:hypothetical protein